MVQTSIAISAALLEKISRVAAEQRRTRNNMIAVMLEDEVMTYERTKAGAFRIVAEPKQQYPADERGKT